MCDDTEIADVLHVLTTSLSANLAPCSVTKAMAQATEAREDGQAVFSGGAKVRERGRFKGIVCMVSGSLLPQNFSLQEKEKSIKPDRSRTGIRTSRAAGGQFYAVSAGGGKGFCKSCIGSLGSGAITKIPQKITGILALISETN